MFKKFRRLLKRSSLKYFDKNENCVKENSNNINLKRDFLTRFYNSKIYHFFVLIQNRISKTFKFLISRFQSYFKICTHHFFAFNEIVIHYSRNFFRDLTSSNDFYKYLVVIKFKFIVSKNSLLFNRIN